MAEPDGTVTPEFLRNVGIILTVYCVPMLILARWGNRKMDKVKEMLEEGYIDKLDAVARATIYFCLSIIAWVVIMFVTLQVAARLII